MVFNIPIKKNIELENETFIKRSKQFLFLIYVQHIKERRSIVLINGVGFTTFTFVSPGSSQNKDVMLSQ